MRGTAPVVRPHQEWATHTRTINSANLPRAARSRRAKLGIVRLTRWKYQCRSCGQSYELPGADLSFFYGWFLGISPSLEAVAFDAIAYPGIGEVEEILDSVAAELPRDADRSDLMSVALVGPACLDPFSARA